MFHDQLATDRCAELESEYLGKLAQDLEVLLELVGAGPEFCTAKSVQWSFLFRLATLLSNDVLDRDLDEALERAASGAGLVVPIGWRQEPRCGKRRANGFESSRSAKKRLRRRTC